MNGLSLYVCILNHAFGLQEFPSVKHFGIDIYRSKMVTPGVIVSELKFYQMQGCDAFSLSLHSRR